MKNIKLLMIAIILIGGALAAWNIIGVKETGHNSHEKHDEHHDDEEEKNRKGPHGGKLFSKGDFQLEVTIYEPDIPPEFRIYPFKKGEPIAPEEVELIIELHRLYRTDVIGFKREGDYLLGDQVVEEPHSFDVKIKAIWEGRTYQWEYSSHEGRAELTEEAVKRAGIVIETASAVTMNNSIKLTGEIDFNTDKVAHVVPRFEGVVREVRKNEGDTVKKGEIIAILDSRELADAKSFFLAARGRKTLVQTRFNREKILWEKKISSEQDYLEVKQNLARAALEVQTATHKLQALGFSSSVISNLSAGQGSLLTKYEIRSPINGTVIEKHIIVGEAVKKYENIYHIADLSNLWATVMIPLKDLQKIKLHQKVSIISEKTDQRVEGLLGHIHSTINKNTQSVTGRVVIPNKNREWRPGQFVSIELLHEVNNVPLAVSAEAIQTFRDWSVVFVKYGNTFEARPLELGRSDGKWVEVLQGLGPGEKYASKNSFVIKAEVGKDGATHDH